MAETLRCPFCQEEIDENIKTCPFCGEEVFLKNNKVQKEINQKDNDNSMVLGIILLIIILCTCLSLIIFDKKQNTSNKQDEAVLTPQEPQKFDTYVGEIPYADLFGLWSPPDPTAKNPHLLVEYASNKNLSFEISWENGVHTVSKTKLICKNEGINALTLYCDGKKYEYYPVRNGQKIDFFDMGDEELPINEEVINEHVHVKYALKQNEKSLMLEPIDTSVVEGELWGSFVKDKNTTTN